jgi:DNA repair protein RecO (recombination protein O)
MSRTFVYSALVLRNRPSGGSNNEVFLLTAEEGIVKATVFGGAKSKLRSHSAPYNSGHVWVYRDPAKDYGKLSDFDVHSWRPGLRELYDRTMAAGGVAETILTTHGGGGDWGKALELAEATLDALESANEELCPRLLVYFLWRWAGFLGIRPEIETCSACGSEAANGPLWFSSRENTLLCGNCVPNGSSVPAGGLLQLNPGCLRWLTAAGSVEPSLLHRYSMDNKSFNEAKALAAAVITSALGKRLASWDW